MVAKGVGGAAELRAWLQAAEARKVAGEGFFEATEETPELAVQERGRGGEQQLSPVQRIKKEIQSDSFVTRLEHIGQMEEVALEMSTTAEDAASTFIPLCQQLARDPEPEIRQSAVEQIAPLVRALAADGRGRRPQVMDLLEVAKRLLGDDADEVRAAAEQSFVSITDHCAHDEASEWLLQAVVGSLLALARSRSRYDAVLRGPAVGVLLRLASSLPSTLFEALVVPQLFQLASDPLVAVRKALATGLPECCRALPSDSECLSDGLLPLFASLCLDSAADVREECSRALVVIAQAAAASRAPGNMGIVVRAVEGLAADPSASVRECALRSLGPLLVESKMAPKELVDLFLNMVDTSASSHSSCSSSSSSSSPHSLPSPQLEFIFAYNFPAVVLVLGRRRWGELDAAFARLLHSFSVPARCCVACSLHELARMLCKPVQQGGADVATWDSSGAEEHESKVESGEEEVGASRDAEGNAAEEGASLETAGERMTASGEAADVEAAGTRAVEVDPLPRLMEAFELIMCDVDEVRMGLMEHFGEFVACLPPAEAQHCIHSLPRALWRLGAIHTLPPSTALGPSAIAGMGAATVEVAGTASGTSASCVPAPAPVAGNAGGAAGGGGGGGGGWGMARGRDRPPPPVLWPDLKMGESAPVVVPFLGASGTRDTATGTEGALEQEGPQNGALPAQGAGRETSTGTGEGNLEQEGAQKGALLDHGAGGETGGKETQAGAEAGEEKEGLSVVPGTGGQGEEGVGEADAERGGQGEEDKGEEAEAEAEGGSREGGPLREGEARDGAVQASADEGPGEGHLSPGEQEGGSAEDELDKDTEGTEAAGMEGREEAEGAGNTGSNDSTEEGDLTGGQQEEAVPVQGVTPEIIELQPTPGEAVPGLRVAEETGLASGNVEERREDAVGAPEPEVLGAATTDSESIQGGTRGEAAGAPEPQTAGAQPAVDEALLGKETRGKEAGEGRTVIVEALNPPELEPSSEVTSAQGEADLAAGEGAADNGAAEGATGPTGESTGGPTAVLSSELESEVTHTEGLLDTGASEGSVEGLLDTSASEGGAEGLLDTGASEGSAEGAPVSAEVPSTVMLSETETQRGRAEGEGEEQGLEAGEALLASASDTAGTDSVGEVSKPFSPSGESGEAGSELEGGSTREGIASGPEFEPEGHPGGTPEARQEDAGPAAGPALAASAGEGREPPASQAFAIPRVEVCEAPVSGEGAVGGEATAAVEGTEEKHSEGASGLAPIEGSVTGASEGPGDASGQSESDQAGRTGEAGAGEAGEGEAGAGEAEAGAAGAGEGTAGVGAETGEGGQGEEGLPATPSDGAGTAPSVTPQQPAETPPQSPSPSANSSTGTPPQQQRQQQLAENPRPSRRQREQLRVQGPQSDWHLRQMVAQQARVLAEAQPSPEVHRVLVDILASLCSDRIAAVREEAAVQLGWMLHHCCCHTGEAPRHKLGKGPGESAALARSSESTQTQPQPSELLPGAGAGEEDGAGRGGTSGVPEAGDGVGGGMGSSGEGERREGSAQQLATEGSEEKPRAKEGSEESSGTAAHVSEGDEGSSTERVGARRRGALDIEGLVQAEGIPIDRLCEDSEHLLNLAAKFAHSTSYRDRQVFVLMFRGLREASCKTTLAQQGRQGSINSQGSSVTALCEEGDGEREVHWGSTEDSPREEEGEGEPSPGAEGAQAIGESEGLSGGESESESEARKDSDSGLGSDRKSRGGAEAQQEQVSCKSTGASSSSGHIDTPGQGPVLSEALGGGGGGANLGELQGVDDSEATEGREGTVGKEGEGGTEHEEEGQGPGEVSTAKTPEVLVQGDSVGPEAVLAPAATTLEAPTETANALAPPPAAQDADAASAAPPAPPSTAPPTATPVPEADAASTAVTSVASEDGEAAGASGEGSSSPISSDSEPLADSGMGADTPNGASETAGGSLPATEGEADALDSKSRDEEGAPEAISGSSEPPQSEAESKRESSEPQVSLSGADTRSPDVGTGPDAAETQAGDEPLEGTSEKLSRTDEGLPARERETGESVTVARRRGGVALTAGAAEDCAKELLLGLMLPTLHQLAEDKVGNVSIPAKQEVAELGMMGFNFLIAF